MGVCATKNEATRWTHKSYSEEEEDDDDDVYSR